MYHSFLYCLVSAAIAVPEEAKKSLIISSKIFHFHKEVSVDAISEQVWGGNF